MVLQSPPRAPDNVSYFTFTRLSMDSLVMSIASFVVDKDITTSGPKSSHIVPNKLTPAVFRSIGSSMADNPTIT